MKKSEFLKELEKRLNILEENEIKDTINEYSDIIDEKKKNGISEEEAVLEFGDIDSLTTEILKAYKINPNYNKSKVDDIIDSSMKTIKKGSKKIEEIADNVVGNNDSTTELIIKIFLVILAFAVISIPFNILVEVIFNLFKMSIPPFNYVLAYTFKFILTICYVGLLAFIIVVLVKKSNKKKEIISENVKKEKPKENKVKEEKIYETKKEEVRTEKVVSNNDTNVISLLVKILITIFVIIPFGFAVFGLSVASVILFVLALSTHFFVGPFLIVFAFAFLFGYLLDIICNALYNNKKVSIIPFFVSIILFSVGITMTVRSCLKLDFIDSLPDNEFVTETITYNRNYNDIKKYLDDEDIKIEIDNTLGNDIVKFEVIYYKDFVELKANYKDPFEVRIDEVKIDFQEVKKLYNIFDEDLGDYKIYNYKEFFTGKIKVYMNEYTYYHEM